MNHRLTTYAPHALAALRVAAALLFLETGIFQLFHWPASNLPPAPPEMATLMLIAGVLELVGGLLLAVGFVTRPVAFVLSGMMAVAYWGFHAPMGPWPVINMGVPAILFCLLFLYLVFAGPGAWAVDNLRRERNATA